MTSAGLGQCAKTTLRWQLHEKTQLQRRLRFKTFPALSGKRPPQPTAKFGPATIATRRRLKAKTRSTPRVLRRRLKAKTGHALRGARRWRLKTKTVPGIAVGLQRRLVAEAVPMILDKLRRRFGAKTTPTKTVKLRCRLKAKTVPSSISEKPISPFLGRTAQQQAIAKAAEGTLRRRLLVKTMPALLRNLSDKFRRRLRVKTFEGSVSGMRQRLRVKAFAARSPKKERSRRRLKAKTRSRLAWLAADEPPSTGEPQKTRRRLVLQVKLG